jgi:glucose-6-phosphate-specific signal transduction histidine kinase
MDNGTLTLGSDSTGRSVRTVGVFFVNLVLTVGLYTLLLVLPGPGNSSIVTVLAVVFGPTFVLSVLSGYTGLTRTGALLGITPAVATFVVVLIQERFFGGQAETLGLVLAVVLVAGLLLATVGTAAGRYIAPERRQNDAPTE